jgi:hypothetical protein
VLLLVFIAVEIGRQTLKRHHVVGERLRGRAIGGTMRCAGHTGLAAEAVGGSAELAGGAGSVGRSAGSAGR